MNIFLYILLFITGTFFGSFFTLAVYRIPKKEDILIKHSYCPNCKHKLGFFDLFPVLSYLFLKGKCRYCDHKIRPRYLILEIFSGLCFVLVGWSLQLNVYSLTSIIITISMLLYISILFIIAGIDKEHKQINKSVLLVGYVLELIYIIYQCTFNHKNVYLYVIYLSWLFIVTIVFQLILKQKKTYLFSFICLSFYMILFVGISIYTLSFIICFIIVGILIITKKENNNQLPVGFYLSICNIVIILVWNIITNYLI